MAGPSPAKGIFGCVWIVGDNRFPSTGQPWIKSGHDDLRVAHSASLMTKTEQGLRVVVEDLLGVGLW
jgi:hypothetical protein